LFEPAFIIPLSKDRRAGGSGSVRAKRPERVAGFRWFGALAKSGEGLAKLLVLIPAPFGF
jgi:hypothetical protein